MSLKSYEAGGVIQDVKVMLNFTWTMLEKAWTNMQVTVMNHQNKLKIICFFGLKSQVSEKHPITELKSQTADFEPKLKIL